MEIVTYRQNSVRGGGVLTKKEVNTHKVVKLSLCSLYIAALRGFIAFVRSPASLLGRILKKVST
jgi:hypothetical protein